MGGCSLGRQINSPYEKSTADKRAVNGIQTVLPDFKEAHGQIYEYVISSQIALDSNNPELIQAADSSN